MPDGHWPEEPFWEPPRPPDLVPAPSFSDERPPAYGESGLSPLALAIYAYIEEKLEPVWEAIDRLRRLIVEAVGRIQEYIDRALEYEHRFIETLVGKVYDYIGIQDGLLRQWTEEWVSEKLSFFSDTLLDLRQRITSDYINLQRYLEDKIAEVNDKLTLELEILGHEVRINGENYDRVMRDLGFVREREVPAKIGAALVVYEVDPNLTCRAVLCSEEAKEEISSEPLVNVLEAEAAIEQDMEDEPTMDGFVIREQAEVIAMLEGLPHVYEEYFNVVKEIGRIPKGEIM